MYTVSVPFTDYKGKERTAEVSFNLDAREVFKMLPELKSTFEWIDSNKNAEPRQLQEEEVRTFYNNFESILLEAYGEMSDDGLYFKKAGKYEFEESALFSSAMWMFVSKPEETTKMLQGVLPKELFDMVKNADPDQLEAAAKTKLDEMAAENARLRAQVEGKTD